MPRGEWSTLALRLCRLVLRPLRGRGLMGNPVLCRLYNTLYWRLARGVVVTTVQDSKMCLDLRHSALAQRLFMTGVHEAGETAVVRRLLGPGMVFADVGANVGYYTLLAARLVGPAGRVHAFEPDPDCCRLLRESVQINSYDHVLVVGTALAAAPGTRWLSQPRNKAKQQLMPSRPDGAATPVEVTTPDAALERDGGRLDLVKLDAEGAEPEILRGMVATLRRNPDLKMLTEFNPQALSELGTAPDSYLQELEAHGFTLYTISSSGVVEPADSARLVRQCRPGQWLNLLCERRP